MSQYFLRRLLLLIPTFIGITVVVFTITRFVPGGPVERMIAKARSQSAHKSNATSGTQISEEQIQALKEYYGFDKPVLASYALWMHKIASWDLGMSTRYGEPVWDTIKSKLPVSTYYGFMTTVLVYLVCIPLGIVKAIKHGSWFDSASSFIVFFGYAIPGFVIGIIGIVVFASYFEVLPVGGFVSDGFEEMGGIDKIIDVLQHSLLPLAAYLAGSFAVMTFLMKNSLLDQLSQDYMRTAMAKGITFKKAVWRHGVQNALIPIATTFGSNISLFLAGSFLIEKVFDIDGLGLLGYEAVVERDYPVVMGILVLTASAQIVGNILSDICVALVDPRVQYR
jgi:microcin C transport system permease protein